MNVWTGKYKGLVGAMGFLLTALAVGCSGGGDGGPAATAQPGTLSVSLTDAPACGYDHVYVTVNRIKVHRSNDLSVPDNDAGWTDIVVDPQSNRIDLLGLTNGVLVGLGETSLGAGHYTQVRLVLDRNVGNGPSFANSVVLQGETEEKELVTPSAVQSGIKLISEFDVPAGQQVDLLLDFDACKSIVQTGTGNGKIKYILKPVIQVVPYVLNGIEGFISMDLLGSNVEVSAQINGEIVRATVPNSTTRRFLLSRLPWGPNTNYDVVITANGHATAVITGVPVPANNSITPVSTNSAPLPVAPPALGTSTTHSITGMVTLSPAPSTDENAVAVFVAAKQTLSGGRVVTVKMQPAIAVLGTNDDFNYNITLPIGAPSVGPYGSLPIAFLQQPSSVGPAYTVKASAAGYQSQSLSFSDISVVSTPQDFTLPLIP